jgi:hypothetical protein
LHLYPTIQLLNQDPWISGETLRGPNQKSTASLTVWHHRLGHANKESIKKLEREGMVRGMEISNSTDEPDSPSLCTSCPWQDDSNCHTKSHGCRPTPSPLPQMSVDLCERPPVLFYFHRWCKGNLTNLRRELHLSLAKGNPK